MRNAFPFLLVLSRLIALSPCVAADVASVVDGLQQRYASAETVAGSFQQNYRAPGISQSESGVFRMKRPGLMRWEYRQPEEKLFIADGREVFLYSPLDRQVTIQPFSASDIHGTPLELLLGGADIKKNFSISWELRPKPVAEQTSLVRLTPRTATGDYDFLVLEIDTKTSDLQRIVIHERSGNTSEFLLANVVVNAKVNKKDFQFKPPKGVEVVRLDNRD
jgi:outer membrane lipoprotein carrier protein